MTRRWLVLAGVAVVLLVLAGWAVSRALRPSEAPAEASAANTELVPPTAGVRHITATLFYAGSDGQSLVPVRQEIVLAEGVVPQGREIVSAQLLRPRSPYVSVIPEGTRLRAFYVTDRGDAFVDLSPEVTSRHPGGSTAELLTVYALVNSVTANLPTIRRVQILIDGQEADTLAGHIDLRNPLERDTSIIKRP
ncbi:MAG: GerMN domain-containing protein [Acidobacteria bacterium]|nr:GerMN domain-containing protein [Acidobacteriota bacterium]